MSEANWAGTHTHAAAALHRPASVEERRRSSPSRRGCVLGSRHSFTDIADSAELVSLEAMPAGVSVDRAAGTATLGGAVRYGELAAALVPEGLALHNLASAHISVAGAVATATHGSGDR